MTTQTAVVLKSLSKEKIDFVKAITGISDGQEALEHYAITCLRHEVDSDKLLDTVKPDNLEGYSIPLPSKKDLRARRKELTKIIEDIVRNHYDYPAQTILMRLEDAGVKI